MCKDAISLIRTTQNIRNIWRLKHDYIYTANYLTGVLIRLKVIQNLRTFFLFYLNQQWFHCPFSFFSREWIPVKNIRIIPLSLKQCKLQLSRRFIGERNFRRTIQMHADSIVLNLTNFLFHLRTFSFKTPHFVNLPVFSYIRVKKMQLRG